MQLLQLGSLLSQRCLRWRHRVQARSDRSLRSAASLCTVGTLGSVGAFVVVAFFLLRGALGMVKLGV